MTDWNLIYKYKMNLPDQSVQIPFSSSTTASSQASISKQPPLQTNQHNSKTFETFTQQQPK
jgi:hypothetical protein